MQDVIDWLSVNWAWVGLCIGALVEVVPIKINPLSALFKWIGKKANKEVIDRIEGLEKRADEQRRSIDENEMDRIRWEVLDFANACRNAQKHTKDEFQHIIALNTKYHALLEKHGIKNGVFDAEYDYVMKLYMNCHQNNSFL